MVDYVDLQYVNMLSNRFPQFQIKSRSPLKVNFRCPKCGDSKKSKTKARAWIIEIKDANSLWFNCFNCFASEWFDSFLQQQDPLLYKDYVADKYIGKTRNGETHDVSPDEAKTNVASKIKDPLKKIKKISQLAHDHPAKKYVENRKIPSDKHYLIYYAPKFMTWINTLIPNKFENIKKDEPRLIFPLYSKRKEVIGVSARSFDPKSGLKYITIMFQNTPKIYGLERVNFSKPYFIVEGAIDSLFLPNSIAMIGADTNFKGIENTENAIFIHDAEPRNLQICKRMERLLNMGYKVCIWPTNEHGKDINEMVLNGVRNIDQIILENTHSGLTGLLEYKAWKKC